MMQNFLIEDIIHHYFIKTLPKFSLSDLLQIKTKHGKVSFSLLEDPDFLKVGEIDFLKLKMDVQYVPEYFSRFDLDFDSVSHMKIRQLFASGFSPKKTQDFGLELREVVDEKNLQDMQIWLSSEVLNRIVPAQFASHYLALSDYAALQSVLVLKNLRMLMPSLVNFYKEDDEVVNMGLSISLKSKQISI